MSQPSAVFRTPQRAPTLAELRGRRVALVLGPSTGGIGRHVATLRGALSQAGADTRVIGPADVLERFGLSGPGTAIAVADPRTAIDLRAALAGAELVHAHGLRAATTAALATWSMSSTPPLISTWHNAVGPSTAGRFATLRARPAERLVARRSVASLCVSPDLLARAFRLGGAARWSPVGAPALPAASRTEQEVRAELGALDRALLVCVARLHPQKGLDVLIDAAARWADHPRRPLVVVAGDGPQRAALETQLRTTGAPVALLGARSDVPDLLRAADLAVLPSRWEGSPLAAHEALQAGAPLVVTSAGGVAALTGDAALVVPPDDPAALAAAVQRLLDDPAGARDLGRRGRLQAARWRGAAGTAEAVLHLYVTVLRERCTP